MKKYILFFTLCLLVTPVEARSEKIKIIAKEMIKLKGTFQLADGHNPRSYKVITIRIPKNTFKWYYRVTVIDDKDGIFNNICDFFKSISVYVDPTLTTGGAIEMGRFLINHLSPEDCNVFLMKSNPNFIMNLNELDCFKKYSVRSVNTVKFNISKRYNVDTFRYIFITNDNKLDEISVEIDAAACLKD